MSKFPRRTFIAGLSTIPFALWFEKYAAAQTKLHIRYNVTSVNGLKMLKIYRDKLHFASFPDKKGVMGSIFNPIDQVLEALGVTLVTKAIN